MPKIKSPKNWANFTPKKISLFKHFKKRKRKGTFKNFLKIAFLMFFILITLSGISGVVAWTWLSKDIPDPDKLLKRSEELSTKIYDRTGKIILYEIYGEKKRTLISLEELPEYIKWGAVVVEDKRFYQHHGFDFKRIVKAFWVNTTQGGIFQGASTITQQFVKNAILTSKKTYARKIKEVIWAYEIENKFSKDQILKMYLNEIPFGSQSYGIEVASQTYFAKSAGDLTLDEAILLVALPKAPTYYSPWGNHREELLARQKLILDLMVQEGHLNKEEAERAKKIDVLKKIVPRKENILAPHFVMYVKELLTQRYGEKVVEQGGLKVITTLDFEKQKIAEEKIKQGVEKNKKWKATNAALVAIDPKTGGILAMVGSKDYFNLEDDGNVNVALRPRQPGSSFKPIVYAAAFKKGYTPSTVLFDLETNFDTTGKKTYIPQNYNKKEHGQITLKNALAGSLNIPAIKVLYLTGINSVLDLAEELGYSTLKDRERFGLALALGAGEVKLLEHTSAFGVFSQEGIKYETNPILKIEDYQGKIIEDYSSVSGQRILDEEVCRQLNDILSDNSARSFIFSVHNNFTLGKRPVAAKTGTTNDFRDAWTMGYTPSLVVGVWAGNNDNSKMKSTGGDIAGPIWNSFMKEVLKNTPIEKFTLPKKIITNKAVLNGKLANETIIKIDRASGKLATDLTPPSFVIEKTYSEVHDILYYVNKDDPRGPFPKNPWKDPQFKNWEKPVQKWIEKQGILNEKPPKEYDDLHIKENQPKITIIFPTDNETISGSFIETKIEAEIPRGKTSKLEFFIDNQLIKTIDYLPQDFAQVASLNFENGFHKLKVKIFDDIDNSAETEINFNLLRENYSPQILWISPENNSVFQIVGVQNFEPIKLNFSLIDIFNPKNIKIYSRNMMLDQDFLIGELNDIQSNQITFDWRDPIVGNYYLYVIAIDKDDKIFQSGKTIIEIK
ncbi:PBP1A family penicillin-binding protein [Candidatus Kuenenbacteria bacterium]|nr:PBP1A family penicillin-binding protein [Candidatus Kuenenbacteria bacterium]